MDGDNISFEGNKAYFILNKIDDDKPIKSNAVIYRLVVENLSNKRGEIHIWLENAITGAIIQEYQKFTMDSLSTKLLARSEKKVNLQSELYDHLVMTGLLTEEEYMNTVKKIALSIMENWFLQGKRKAEKTPEQSTKTALMKLSQEEITDAIELVFSPDILKIIDNEIGKYVIGEENSRMYIFLSMMQSFTKEYPQITVIGESGIGKSFITNCVLDVFPDEIVYKTGRISKRALEYATQIKDRKILYIQESRGGSAASDSIRLTSSSDGGMKATIANRETGEADELIVPPLTLITTQTEVGLHHEDETRNTKVYLSSDIEQNIRVVEHQGREAEFPIELRRIMGIEDDSKKNIIINAIRLLVKDVDVIIPYEVEVSKCLIKNKIRIKRDHKKLIGLVKAIALLYQTQREWLEVDGTKWIIADVEDIKKAIYYGETPLTQSYHNLDVLGKQLLDCIIQVTEDNKQWTTDIQGAQTTQISEKVAEVMGYSYGWVSPRLEHMVNNSMLFKKWQSPENLPNGNYYTVSEETYDSIFTEEIDFDKLEKRAKDWKPNFIKQVTKEYRFYRIEKEETLEKLVESIVVEE